ncbi:hypothetical protein [Methylobacterium sp. 17Sr1-1]|uniref:hypothetical protein n=1 Tax=Methylobacterium sp. 17Sr1-1 TaxID=2202826 RepID=UPI000D6EB722|nr:hypothetical protein [Methylobacterium sp. 17Sr1-1]AWN51593.1 hypothetical protein DK412_07720 [Methylobacterium sp. 17Sr1-1]
MLTLRTLKKKSKQALPILLKHYGLDPADVFLAERGENYHGLVVRCTHGAGDPCRVEDRPRCGCTSHPLKGTPMTGEVSGYYEPEWGERTTLETLVQRVMWDDRPATMTDREWRRTLAIAGVTPVTEAEIDAWAREDSTTPANIDSLPEQAGGRA